MELIRTIEFCLRLIEGNNLSQRVGGIDHPVVFVLDPDVKRSVVGKTVCHQRVSTSITSHTALLRNADRFLPNRPRVSDFKNFCGRIKEPVQIAKINMGAGAIGPEIVHSVEGGEINFSSHPLSGL